MTAKYVWMNGKLVDYQNACVHFLSAGLQYGLGVFEGIRCYRTASGPAVFRLQDHVERLFGSAHILGMIELPYTREEVSQAILQTISSNEHEDCYIRPSFYLGQGGMNMITDAAKPELAVATWEWGQFFSKEAKEQGIRANIASFTRLHPNIMMTKAKISGNYVSSALAKTESKRNGFDEAIMLGPDGFISECTGENIFVVRGDRIFTPPTAAILEGITRDSVFQLAGDVGYRVEEQQISRDQLYLSDEIFVCGTAAEVVAIREVDYRRIGAGKMGPVTRQIQQAFEAVTHGRHRFSQQWLTYVEQNAAEARS